MSIKSVREDKRLLVQECADALGVSRQTYAKYEADPTQMSVAQAEAVCRFLGCGFDEVYASADRQEEKGAS